jgi:type I restriction enzyme S subunit
MTRPTSSVAPDAISSAPSWRRVHLRDLCDQVRQVLQAESAEAKRRPYVSLENIQSEGGQIVGLVGDGTVGKSMTFAFSPREVLYGKLRPYLNKVALPDFDGRCTTELIPLRPKPGVDRDFLAWLLRRPETVAAAMQEKTGSRMPRADMDSLMSMEVSAPSEAEQKRIATRLNRQLVIVDRAKAAAKERLRAANALAPAYVMREFTGGQSKQWPRKTLQTLSLGNGQYGTSQKSHPTEAPGTVPVLGIGNIKGGAVVWHRLKFTSLSSEDGVKYRLKAGDLIFCRTNSAELVGETAVFDGSRDAAFASYLVRFRLNPELADPRFVSTYINSPWGRHFIQQNLSRAIGQANVSASVVANMEIPAPPVAVQRSIMDRLAHATAGVGRLAQQVSEELHSISRMPTALLRAAFQGDT